MHLIYKDHLLSYFQGVDGQDRCIIDLSNLFVSQQERILFESKWQSFLHSDPSNPQIILRSSNFLEYLTESIIPPHSGLRPPMLLLFGNPAPHSVKAGAMFSSEGNQREHRIWGFLAKTGVLAFNDRPLAGKLDANWRTKELLTANYESPFQIAMASFLSLPSSASDNSWSGVAGVKKLFGAKAFNKLCNSEAQRLRAILEKFMPDKGIVLAFQKDAFNNLRSINTPPYSLRACLSATLIGSIEGNPNIFLGAIPPTRLILSSRAKTVFIKLTKEGFDTVFRA